MSLATIVDNTVTALQSEFGWSSLNRMSSDFRNDLDSLDAGETKYQLQQQYEAAGGTPNTNTVIERGSIEILAYHKLAEATGERTYTEGAMRTEQASLMSKFWWSSNVAGARSWDRPDLQTDVGREGNVILWGVLITFDIAG